jgi:hypothetical protein
VAIDVNEEVKVWGGFNPLDFWLGVGILLLLAALALLIGIRIAPLLGGIFFSLAGGGFAGFMVYRQSLPKGMLLRRFLQDGSFLFLKVPGIHGVDVYQAVAARRAERFTEAFLGTHDDR